MKSIDNLRQDHETIRRSLKPLIHYTSKLQQDENVNKLVFTTLIDFFVTFVDKCHHGKEERILFPLLESYWIPREDGPIGVLLYEHEEGRNLVRDLSDAIERYYRDNKDVVGDIIRLANGYSELLYQHIEKENSILFPWAEQLLSSSDDRHLIEKFGEIENEISRCKEFIELIEKLEKEATT